MKIVYANQLEPGVLEEVCARIYAKMIVAGKISKDKAEAVRGRGGAHIIGTKKEDDYDAQI